MKKYLPQSTNNPQGFTLIELMVTISIIAILSVIGFNVFTGAQAVARDGVRAQEIESIAKALEIKKVASGTLTYVRLSGTDFAKGTVPVDPSAATRVPRYCIISKTNNTIPIRPTKTTWLNTMTCPPANAEETVETVAVNTPGADPTLLNKITNFHVCALYEKNWAGVICVTSQQ